MTAVKTGHTGWGRAGGGIAAAAFMSACVVAVGLAFFFSVRPHSAQRPDPLPVARDVVFVVPHEDDESLFAGELIEHYRLAGSNVKLIYATRSQGGTVGVTDPAYGRVRRHALRTMLRGLPGVGATIAPIPDGGALGVRRKTARLAEFLRLPGMVPRDAAVFVIAGQGNSDHVDSREDVMALMARRGRPLYLYWGYGADTGGLDPQVFGRPVAFAPSRRERAFKRWAIGVYDRLVYRAPAFAAYRPRIMDAVGDDVVTVVGPPSRGSTGR